MSLNHYCTKILTRELSKADYDGKTVDQGWTWLMVPIAQSPIPLPNGLKLTPVVFAGLVGATKANAVAGAIKQAFPLIADALMNEGIDPTKVESAAFLSQLVQSNILSSDDINLIKNSAVRVVQQPPLPCRFDERFNPIHWSHVAADGSEGTENDLAISGFPNVIDRSDFDIAWTLAGRN